MYPPLRMSQRRNSVRVVLLIARVGEGRAYPGSTFARRFNAVGVELFPRRHGYSEEIHGGLRLESVTPMALKGIIYKIRCVETQRNIYYFKK